MELIFEMSTIYMYLIENMYSTYLQIILKFEYESEQVYKLG